MDAPEEERSPIDIERESLLKYPFCAAEVAEPFGYEDFMREMQAGKFLIKDSDDKNLLLIRTYRRELIPLPDVPYISSRLKRYIRQNKFTVSTNWAFDQVVQECMAPRENNNYYWLSERYKEFLRQAHREGFAHSVEIWRGEDLVSGTIGLQFNAVYISISTFSLYNNAGNAAFAETQGRLCRGHFIICDSILPSRFSRSHGGQAIPLLREDGLRKVAVQQKAVFPLEPVFMPPYFRSGRDYIEPT